MRKKILTASVAIAGLSAAACTDQLSVSNPNEPDVARAYATMPLIEGVIQGLGAVIFNNERANEGVNTQSKILSGENYASVANFGMATRAAVPRSIISNELGNDNQVGNLNLWRSFSISARTAANALKAFDELFAQGKTLGSGAQNARARAFAFFMLGHAQGNVALAYDSGAVVTHKMAANDIPPLVGYQDVMKASLEALDSAIAVANSPAATAGGNGFPLPTTWLNGQALTRDQFVALVRSFKARFRAGVARTPTERAAVDWAAVIADANAGIKADFAITIGNSSGWTATFDENQGYVNGYQMMPMYYYGMADVSNGYTNWLSTPRDQRKAFLVVTPDKRWPAGTTRAAQQATSPTLGTLPAGQYIRNRPSGEDIVLTGYGDTWYENRRYGAVNVASHSGPYVDVSYGEISMLAAEGYIRTGNIPAARTLINDMRTTRGGLPAVTVNDATSPISTDKSTCVPQVPVGPNFTTTECGSLFEAMKYEKRMETAFTGYLIWYTDNRSWGDLLEGTVMEWPVPYQEMQARSKPFYNGRRQAPKGTYGF